MDHLVHFLTTYSAICFSQSAAPNQRNSVFGLIITEECHVICIQYI